MATLIEVTNPTDKVEIVGKFKHIQVRAATWVEKDGVKIGQPDYHRHVVAPGQTSDIPEIQAIVSAVHTPEIVAAYEAHIAEQTVNEAPAEEV